MSTEREPAKVLLPYLQRADELQQHEPLVAYYCRLYAMERGLKIPQSERTKTTSSILLSLINQLEKDKKSLKLGPDDNLHVEGFALNVFAKADKQDRAGRADLNTAKTFYAASIFFEILNQFGVLQPDLEQKQKYAAWKAADIRKALKEGRKPVPGPPGDEPDITEPSTAHHDASDLPAGGTNLDIRPAPENDPSSHAYNGAHYSSKISSPPKATPPSPHHVPLSPPAVTTSYHSDEYTSHNDYPPHDFQPPPSVNLPENSSYPQPYHHQPYAQHYPSHDIPSSYPNFQSYPSFAESSLPSVPSHNPSYHQGLDASYSSSSPSNSMNYPSNTQYSPNERNRTSSESAVNPTKTYQYDSNYNPPPEKIAEAHKAARFAVGALAFDDVAIAVDYLKKSLELLTNPSAAQ